MCIRDLVHCGAAQAGRKSQTDDCIGGKGDSCCRVGPTNFWRVCSHCPVLVANKISLLLPLRYVQLYLGKPRDLLNFREDVHPEFRIIEDELEFVGVTWETAENYTKFMKLADGADTHKVRSLQTGSADQTTRCGLTVQTCPESQ